MFTEEIQTYLQETKIPLRLSCVSPNGWPMVLSLWYLYEEGVICCATQESARVVEALRSDPRCAFEIASDQPPYCGVRCQATAEIDGENGIEVLRKLLQRYLGSLDKPLAKKLLSRKSPEVALRLKPVNVFSWNFSERMKASVEIQDEKPCPPR